MGYLVKRTYKGLPSLRITPKSMTYRDTAYLYKEAYTTGKFCDVIHQYVINTKSCSVQTYGVFTKLRRKVNTL